MFLLRMQGHVETFSYFLIIVDIFYVYLYNLYLYEGLKPEEIYGEFNHSILTTQHLQY